MKKDILYNQVNPLIRVKEGDLLNKSQWEAVKSASTLEALEKVLSTTNYAGNLAHKNFPEDFEKVLQERRQAFFEWAYSVAPEKELVDVYTLRYTFHNLKVLTKGELTEKNLDHLYVPDGRFSLDVVKSAIKTQSSSLLPDYIVKGIQEVKAYFDEGNILQGVDVIYDRIYLTEMKKIALSLGYKELIDEVESFIDLTNITIMARGILQKQTVAFLTTVLSSSGSIPKKDYLTYAESNLEEFTTFVLNTKYRELLSSIVEEQTLVINKLAFLKDSYMSHFYERSKTLAFGPLPLLALMDAKELEEKNLRLIVAGLTNGFSKETILERMRGGNEL